MPFSGHPIFIASIITMAKILLSKPEGNDEWQVVEQPNWNSVSSESLAVQIIDRTSARYVEWTMNGVIYRVMEDDYVG